MKTIPLTQGKVALVDDEDFERLSCFKWKVQRQRGKHVTRWYAVRAFGSRNNRKWVLMHRYILNAPADKQVDHRDGNTLDNRRSNLRLSTRAENSRNRRKANGSSRYKGVSWFSGEKKWHAEITKAGVKMSLGYYRCEEDAAIVYNVAAQLLFSEFAWLNDV